MKIFINYIIKNIKHVFYVLLLSIFFVFLIFPLLIRLHFIESFLFESSPDTLIAITGLILFFLIFSWEKCQKLWQRYRNTYDLKNPPFIYIDYIVLFISFSAILITLFQAEDISISSILLKFKAFASINFILIIGWVLSSYYWKDKREKQTILNEDKLSLSDEPIQFIEQDLLNRKRFIEDLQKEIENISSNDSFIFGLYGSWGEGKTSFINLLTNKFMKNDDFLIINFDPWNFKDEEAILSAFYNQMEQSISQKFILPESKKTFIKYQKLISLGLSQAGIKIDFSDTKESIKEIKQRIESYITQTKKKIIIFIDDIDRLQPNEILLVFKLVRLSANFKNTIFLLALDPIVVQNYFKSNLKIDLEFLEKIVQKSIPLPAIEQQYIDQFLDDRLEKLFDELAISKERREKLNKDFSLIYQTQIRKFFKTLRRVKRYLNGLRSTLPPIKNEVNLHDFLILEIIRNFFSKIYDDIWDNPWSYLATKWDIGYYFSSPFVLNIEDDKKYEIIKEHIGSITEDEKDSELLKGLLKELFFEVEDSLDQNKLRLGQKDSDKTYRIEKRITHPECFKKYFMLKVPSSDISDEFIEATLDLWHSIKDVERENVISKTIFELQEKSILPKFFNKLKVFIDKIPEEVAYDIIKVIYRNAGEFSKKGAGNFESSEYLNSINLLLLIINDKIEKSKIYSVLEETVMYTPCIYFAVLVVGFCQKRGGGSFYNIYESANLNKLQNEVANRLKKYFVDGKRDIFEEVSEKDRGWIFVLYQWGSNWESFKGDNNKIVNDYVLSLIKNDIKKFIAFLTSQEGVAFSDAPVVFNLKEISRIYNLSDLNKLAEKFKDNPTLSSKEKETIEIFLKTYQTYKANK
jgi:predicted KAP-like P-loop ATPase